MDTIVALVNLCSDTPLTMGLMSDPGGTCTPGICGSLRLPVVWPRAIPVYDGGVRTAAARSV